MKKNDKRRLTMLAAVLCCAMTMMVSLTSCTNNSDIPVEVTDSKPFTYDREIDNSVRPGDDFYKYALGQWLNDDNRSPSIFKQINEEQKAVLKKTLATSADPLLVLLRGQVDEAMSNDSRSVALLRERLQMLEQIETADQLHVAFTTLHQLGYSPLFRVVPFIVEGREVINLIITGGKTVEMDTVMARKDSKDMVERVTSYCQRLRFLGYSDERIAKISEHATSLEQILMNDFLINFEMLRHPLPLTRAITGDEDMDKAIGSVVEMMGLEKSKLESNRLLLLGVGITQLMVQLAKASQQQDLISVFRDYMIYNVISQDAYCVPKQTGMTDRFDILNNLLHYNRYYKYRILVENYGYDNIYKQQCQDILERMRQVFIQRVEKLDWMGAATKAEAIKKAAAMTFYIGYPDKWNDAMTPQVSGDCLLATATQLRQHSVESNKKMIGKHLDDIGWDFWAIYSAFTTDNAFHLSSANALTILPSWITRPRFNEELSEATLYATATTFGHEFCHGFDSGGSAYDADGKSCDWWQPDDKLAFQTKQQALIQLYNQLEDYPGKMSDGEKTLQEDMADYGGIELALACYKQRLTEQGFSGIQFDEQIKKFFLSYAQIWKQEQELSVEGLKVYETDTHSVPHNRVNGMMRLQDDWYRLYDVKPSNKLYVDPKNRVKIW